MPPTNGSDENGTFTISLNCLKKKCHSLNSKPRLCFLEEDKTKFMFLFFGKLEITHLEAVWTGPNPLIAVNSLKYWGTENPMKIEKPNMNMFRKLLRLTNWRNVAPTQPVYSRILENLIAYQRICKYDLNDIDLPTYPKKTQYNAAMMGAGIDAKIAPNLPAARLQISQIITKI